MACKGEPARVYEKREYTKLRGTSQRSLEGSRIPTRKRRELSSYRLNLKYSFFMFSPDLLKQRVFLITGGASGLGLAMAKRMLSLGARVAICGRNGERLEAAQKELATTIETAKGYVCDVRDFDAVGQMVQQITADFGSLDSLINNAAGNFLCPSEELSPNAFRSIVDIVLHGTFNCTQHVGRALISSGRPGVILNIVTTYIEPGSSFVLPSACAKAGVSAMTNTLAYEWATYGIRVNSIAPGPFPTEGAWSRLVQDKKFENILEKRVPLGRFGNPEELANLAAFLMSDLAAYITGESVTIDGGERLNAGQFNFITQMMPREDLKKLFRTARGKGGE